MLKVFCSPSRYVQGIDATRFLGTEMKRMGLVGKTLIIANQAVRKILEPLWVEALGQEKIAFSIVEFGGECSREEIARCVKEAKHLGSQNIVGVGGGKVLDAARAVADELGAPIVCCPTVAASDSPCSALSVIYTPKGVFEKCQFYRKNPDLILVDSTVIARAPVRFLIAGMGDGLATWFEADTAHRAFKKNQVGGASTIAAMAIARTCYETLLAEGVSAVCAVKKGAVTPSVERVIEANTLLSGLGFESGGLAMAHSVHNGLTVAQETHQSLHGEKVAFGTLTQLVFEGSSRHVLDQVLNFCISVGLPVTLRELGLKNPSRDLIRSIAQRAVAEGETIHNEPVPVSWQAVVDAILAADAEGESKKAELGSNQHLPV
jgi:glycerol dehydrogenase